MKMLSESISVVEVAEQYDSKEWTRTITVKKPEDTEAAFSHANLLFINFGQSLWRELLLPLGDDGGWCIYPPLSTPSLKWEDHPDDKALINISWCMAVFKKRK